MVPGDIRGVVGQVEEQADVVHGTVFFKVRLKEPGGLHIDLGQDKQTVDFHFQFNVLTVNSLII